jgi:AraC family transcriptional regulator, transcriptional activator FtrA
MSRPAPLRCPARTVAVLVTSTVRPLELSIYRQVFEVDRAARGAPAFGFVVAGEHPGVPVGPGVTPTAGLDRLAAADVVAVAPPLCPGLDVGAAVGEALHGAVDAGARILAVGAAVFTLAATGLLDGRRVACHGRAADRLARRYPRVRVVPGVRYVDDDPILTAAGVGAGLDLCLHLVRKDHGVAAADAIARRPAVSPPRRRPLSALRWHG